MVVNAIQFQILVTSYTLRLVLLLIGLFHFVCTWFLASWSVEQSNARSIVPAALNHVFIFRETMSTLMVMDLSQQNQQRSDTFIALVYYFGNSKESATEKLE